MRTFRLRAALAVASTAAAALGAVVISSPATAVGEELASEVVYSCTEPPFPAGDSTWDLTVKAPKYANVFAEILLEVTLKPARTTPVEIPANGINGTVNISVTGPVTSGAKATGLTNPTTVPVGQQVVLTGGTAKVDTWETGIHQFTPTSFELKTWMNTVLACTPKNGAPVAAQTKVLGPTPTIPPTP